MEFSPKINRQKIQCPSQQQDTGNLFSKFTQYIPKISEEQTERISKWMCTMERNYESPLNIFFLVLTFSWNDDSVK